MSLISHLFNRKGQDVSIEEEKPFVEETEDELMDEDDEELEENPSTEEDNSNSEEVYEVLEREIHPAKIICPDCGGITLEGFEYCDKCGGELIQ